MVESVKRVSKSEDLAKARKRLKEKEKELVSSGASAILAEINKDPAKKKTFDQMTTSQQAQYISKQFTLGNASAGQAWVSYKSALNRCDRLEKEIQQGKANAQVKEDASRGNEAKKQVRRKRMTSRPRPIPKKVMEAANEQQAHATYLEDSNHNRIYLIRSGNEPKARTLSLMIERNGEQVSETIPMNSEVMKLLNQARKMDKTNSDFGEIMKALNVGREEKPTNVLSEVTVIDKKPEIKKIDLMQDMTVKEAKLKITPTVTLVPKIKKNGEPSKKNFNIQLMDADGKIFVLTKDMIKKAVKQKNAYTTSDGQYVDHSVRVDETWNKYVEQAKEGKLPPETVASFFKEAKPNIPQTQLTAVQMAQMKDASRNG